MDVPKQSLGTRDTATPMRGYSPGHDTHDPQADATGAGHDLVEATR